MILNVIKVLLERQRRTELVRKQMKMIRRYSKELDIMLAAIGIDYSNFELCPILVENDKKEN